MFKKAIVLVAGLILFAPAHAEEKVLMKEPQSGSGRSDGMFGQKQTYDKGRKGKEEMPPMNLEIGLYDFVDKTFDFNKIFRGNTFLLACNFKLLDLEPSKKFVVTYGPYFYENHGSDDLGLRAVGYFYPSPRELLLPYGALSGAAGYSFRNQNIIVSLDLKIGAELPIDIFEIFLETGIGYQTSSIYINLMVNSGIRVNIF